MVGPIKGFIPVLSLLLLFSTLALNAPAPASSLRATHNTPRSAPVRVLDRGNIRPLYFFTLQVLMPIDPAIKELEILYNTVLHNAVSSWSGLPSQTSIVVHYNQLELAFFSGAGAIEWDFVAHFAATMLHSTRSGFAGTFQQTWSNPGTTTAISILLRLRP